MPGEGPPAPKAVPEREAGAPIPEASAWLGEGSSGAQEEPKASSSQAPRSWLPGRGGGREELARGLSPGEEGASRPAGRARAGAGEAGEEQPRVGSLGSPRAAGSGGQAAPRDGGPRRGSQEAGGSAPSPTAPAPPLAGAPPRPAAGWLAIGCVLEGQASRAGPGAHWRRAQRSRARPGQAEPSQAEPGPGQASRRCCSRCAPSAPLPPLCCFCCGQDAAGRAERPLPGADADAAAAAARHPAASPRGARHAPPGRPLRAPSRAETPQEPGRAPPQSGQVRPPRRPRRACRCPARALARAAPRLEGAARDGGLAVDASLLCPDAASAAPCPCRAGSDPQGHPATRPGGPCSAWWPAPLRPARAHRTPLARRPGGALAWSASPSRGRRGQRVRRFAHAQRGRCAPRGGAGRGMEPSGRTFPLPPGCEWGALSGWGWGGCMLRDGWDGSPAGEAANPLSNSSPARARMSGIAGRGAGERGARAGGGGCQDWRGAVGGRAGTWGRRSLER